MSSIDDPAIPAPSGPRIALDAIGQLPDTELDVAGAALQLARVDQPEADWRAAQAHLSVLARDAAALDAGDLPGRARLLRELLADQHGYRGDRQAYDDPANANLIQVIERRRGLPVALGILWLHCAAAAGWHAHGVDFPGHFLAALTDGASSARGRQLVFDPFAGGRTLDAEDLRRLARQVEGPDAVLRPGLLRPMPVRDVLLRLQNNIKLRRLQAGNLPQALTCIEDMLRIAPDAPALWREAAQLHEAQGHVAGALQAWQRFLVLVPRGDAADSARNAAESLRTRLN